MIKRDLPGDFQIQIFLSSAASIISDWPDIVPKASSKTVFKWPYFRDFVTSEC